MVEKQKSIIKDLDIGDVITFQENETIYGFKYKIIIADIYFSKKIATLKLQFEHSLIEHKCDPNDSILSLSTKFNWPCNKCIVNEK